MVVNKVAPGLNASESMKNLLSTGATFSSCQKYRYTLWRIWDPRKPFLLCVLLNPSTADETQNDPTVERCQRRAVLGGYGGLFVGNIFALRSTDPKELYRVDDPVGSDNNTAILSMAKQAQTIMCGWGTHGNLLARGAAVLKLLSDNKLPVFCLGQNKDGTPKHPLYVGYSVIFHPLFH